MQAVSMSEAGMEKLEGVLKKAAIIEAVIWIVVAIVAIIIYFSVNLLSDSGPVWIVIVITIILGLASAIILYFAATDKDGILAYKIWFVGTISLIMACIAGIITASILLGAEGWIEIVCFAIVIPIKVYYFVLVLKFYKWNNRARGLSGVASAISSALS